MRGLLSRQLLWAIVVSAAIHFLLVFSAEILLPDGSQSGDLIEITLAPLPPKQAPAPAAKPKTDKPQPAAKKPARPKPVSKPAEPPAPAEAPAAPAPDLMAEAPAAQETAPVPPPEPPAEPAPAPIPDEPVVVPPAPKMVDIDFLLTRGNSDTSVGKVQQRFRLEPDNRYTLHSVAEASGLVSLFISGKFEEHSEGLVTEQGLRPLNFRQLRGKGKTQTARFDWEAHTVALEAGERKSSAEIADGTQDMLSFLYQFMFVPPLDQMRVTVANGKRLKTYAYAFDGEHKLATRMGTLRTIHISRSSGDADEKTEIWLAQDYRYLPVKIRQTDKDGTITEQLAVRLQIE